MTKNASKGPVKPPNHHCQNEKIDCRRLTAEWVIKEHGNFLKGRQGGR